MTRALRGGRELGGQRELEGEKAEGVTELDEEAFDEHQGHDRSAGDAGASCDRSWEAKILSLPFWKRCFCLRMRWDGFSGQVGLPHGCSLFSAPLLCCLAISTGNPGVCSANPYPYP